MSGQCRKDEEMSECAMRCVYTRPSTLAASSSASGTRKAFWFNIDVEEAIKLRIFATFLFFDQYSAAVELKNYQQYYRIQSLK